MKHLFTIFFCAISFGIFSQNTIKGDSLGVEKPNEYQVKTLEDVMNKEGCFEIVCITLYCNEPPKPSADMYIRHYFGISYWD